MVNRKQLILFWLIITCVLYSQDSVSLNIDTSEISVQLIDSNLLDTYRSDQRFIYQESLREEISLWDSFLKWLNDLFPETMKSIEYGLNTILLYGLITVAVILTILHFSDVKIQSFFKKNEETDTNVLTFQDNIHEIDIDELIRNFEQSENFREALRYRFLNLLKWLDKKKLIAWKVDKTNYHYIYELNQKQADFRTIVSHVERVCYGEFIIHHDDYISECKRYNEFMETI